jgi:hypothetical protein
MLPDDALRDGDPMTSVLDRLDELEREAKAHAFWADGSPADEAQLITVSRVHFRALIDVARAAEQIDSDLPDYGAGAVRHALAPLLTEEGEA